MSIANGDHPKVWLGGGPASLLDYDYMACNILCDPQFLLSFWSSFWCFRNARAFEGKAHVTVAERQERLNALAMCRASRQARKKAKEAEVWSETYETPWSLGMRVYAGFFWSFLAVIAVSSPQNCDLCNHISDYFGYRSQNNTASWEGSFLKADCIGKKGSISAFSRDVIIGPVNSWTEELHQVFCKLH